MGSKGLVSPEVWELFLVKYISEVDLEQGLAFAFPAPSVAGSKPSCWPGLCGGEPVLGSAAAQQPLILLQPLGTAAASGQASISQIHHMCPEQAALAFHLT